MKASTRFCEIFAFLGFTGWMRERSHAQVNRSNSWPPYFLQKLSTGVKTRTSQECSLCASRHRLRQLQHESVACRGLQLGQSAIFFFASLATNFVPSVQPALKTGTRKPCAFEIQFVQHTNKGTHTTPPIVLHFSCQLNFYTIKAKKATRRKG